MQDLTTIISYSNLPIIIKHLKSIKLFCYMELQFLMALY